MSNSTPDTAAPSISKDEIEAVAAALYGAVTPHGDPEWEDAYRESDRDVFRQHATVALRAAAAARSVAGTPTPIWHGPDLVAEAGLEPVSEEVRSEVFAAFDEAGTAALTEDQVVVVLPKPDGRNKYGPTWSMPGSASPVTIAIVDGQAYVSALGPADPADFAERFALAVLAGVRAVRRLAAEAGDGGE